MDGFLLLGNITGALLDPGGTEAKLVEFFTANGELKGALVLLSITKVTVWGSATLAGLYQLMLCPELMRTSFGLNTSYGSVAFPPPA
jgi:hypothetical protein